MGNQNINIIEKIVTWYSSFVGILTLLIIIITASRVILTTIREKHGENSLAYRNGKVILSVFSLVVLFNSGWIITGKLAKILSNPYIGTMAVIIVYILGTSLGIKKKSAAIHLITMTITITGLINVLNTMPDSENLVPCGLIVVLCILFFAFSLSIALVIAIGKMGTEKDISETKVTIPAKLHMPVLLILFWVYSMYAAYIAGEYTIISKIIKYYEEHTKTREEKAEIAVVCTSLTKIKNS